MTNSDSRPPPTSTDLVSELVGCWKVIAHDMLEGRSVSLIGGLPGEFAEFTADGRYRVDLRERQPCEYRYRATAGARGGELDVWSEGMASRPARCLYRVNGPVLTICIAGDSRPRPDDVRRDDKRLWCIQTFEKADPPRRRKRGDSPPTANPGSFIPTAFLKSPPSSPAADQPPPA